MENLSDPSQTNPRLDSPSHELRSTSPNEQPRNGTAKNHLKHENPNVSAQPHKRSRNSNPPLFPQDIIVEILSNLPVISLLRFRCVSKSWKALIADPSFIKKHLEKTQNDPGISNERILLSTCTLSTQTSTQFSVKPFSLRAIFEDPVVYKAKIGYPLRIGYGGNRNEIVGSCNGLICIAISEYTVILSNPTLRVCKKLPDLPSQIRKGSTEFGFGFDASVDDYKVVSVFCYRKGNKNKNIVRVYSLRTNSWRKIRCFPFDVTFCVEGIHLNGTLNWCAVGRRSSSWTIVSFDLARETYKEVMQPCYDNGGAKKYERSLGVLDGRLCVRCDYGRLYADVWIMEEYGKRESWTKLVTFTYFRRGPELFDVPLFVSESGEMLLRYGTDLIIYDPKKNMFRSPVIPALDGSFIWGQVIYGESLVSPVAVNQH